MFRQQQHHTLPSRELHLQQTRYSLPSCRRRTEQQKGREQTLLLGSDCRFVTRSAAEQFTGVSYLLCGNGCQLGTRMVEKIKDDDVVVAARDYTTAAQDHDNFDRLFGCSSRFCAVRRGPCDPRMGFKWVIEGDIASCFDEIGHRLLRRYLKKRIQDEQLLDLITKMLRCGIWEEGTLTYPTCGTPQGAI
ncbi:MAG: hypothetical protein L0312_33740, partial [Acidobacteria bacterium]|nr:hypothetical protein [Acidobacteriota bacterium]